MRAAVVYESLFGNTCTVAKDIAEGIRGVEPSADVSCTPVTEDGPAVGEADLLVVGGPTHFLGMTSQRSRRMALQYRARSAKGEPHHTEEEQPIGPGVREWLAALPHAGGRPAAAAFDTRLDTLFPGSAARLIGRSLRDHGYQITAAPEGFTVAAMEGPLSPGERERARPGARTLIQPQPDPSQKTSPPRSRRRARSA